MILVTQKLLKKCTITRKYSFFFEFKVKKDKNQETL